MDRRAASRPCWPKLIAAIFPPGLPEPLIELVSTESVPIQAADIAASVARELWRRNDLPHLVKHFEYVTFNGERLSDGRAEQYEAVFRATSN